MTSTLNEKDLRHWHIWKLEMMVFQTGKEYVDGRI